VNFLIEMKGVAFAVAVATLLVVMNDNNKKWSKATEIAALLLYTYMPRPYSEPEEQRALYFSIPG
jgi:hypothetical protein